MAKFGEMNALAAGGSGYQALVCIFLAGGNEGHNTVIPISTAQQNYSLYQQGRQSRGQGGGAGECGDAGAAAETHLVQQQ
jgi:uncharacterized protein (DUF1501 family)